LVLIYIPHASKLWSWYLSHMLLNSTASLVHSSVCKWHVGMSSFYVACHHTIACHLLFSQGITHPAKYTLPSSQQEVNSIYLTQSIYIICYNKHFLLSYTYTLTTQKFPSQTLSNSQKMASKMESKFPPQSQKTQPGKEHAMDPLPQSIHTNYKPANKLQV